MSIMRDPPRRLPELLKHVLRLSGRSRTGDCMRILARSISRIENEDLKRNGTSAGSHPASKIPCCQMNGPCSARIIPCFTE